MKTICTKCFHKPCRCLKPRDSHTLVEVRSKVIQTRNALLVTLKRQVINGVKFKPGYEIWLNNESESSIRGDRKIMVPNQKLNAIIKMIGIEKMKNQ